MRLLRLFALVTGLTLAAGAGLALGRVQPSQYSEPPSHLQTLRYEWTAWKPDPIERGPAQHMSHNFILYYNDVYQDDEVWIGYSQCGLTSRGAMRLTAYIGKRGGMTGAPNYVDDPADVVLFSKTLVDRKRSDNFILHYNQPMNTNLYLHVDIPSRAGCKSWYLGSVLTH